MDNQQNIKLVRLQSGEDVIADITSDSDSTILNNPMVLIEYYLNAIKTVTDEALHSEGILEEFNSKNQAQATEDLLASREIEEYYDDDTSAMDEYLNKMNKPDKSKLH